MNKGLVLVLLTALLLGIGNTFGAEAAKTSNPLVVFLYANFVTAASFFIYAKLTRMKTKLRLLVTKFWKESACVILTRSIIGSILFLLGLSMTTAVKAMFAARLEPLFILIVGAFLFRKAITSRQALLVGLVVLGAFLLSTSGRLEAITASQIGDFLIIISVFLFAYSYFPVSRVVKEVSPITMNMFGTFVAGIVTLPIFLLALPQQSFMLTGYGWELLLLYVFMTWVIGMVLWTESLRTVEPWVVSSMLSLVPVITGVFAFFWIGEALGMVQLAGAGIILAASYLVAKETKAI